MVDRQARVQIPGTVGVTASAVKHGNCGPGEHVECRAGRFVLHSIREQEFVHANPMARRRSPASLFRLAVQNILKLGGCPSLVIASPSDLSSTPDAYATTERVASTKYALRDP